MLQKVLLLEQKCGKLRYHHTCFIYHISVLIAVAGVYPGFFNVDVVINCSMGQTLNGHYVLVLLILKNI